MASKSPAAHPRAGEGLAAEAVRAPDVSPRQERLLSEISHELGNYFHKLYYWAELLREQRAPSADAEPATLLERTIRELEVFLKSTLEFFRPISVVPMAMDVTDVVRSVRAVVARHVEPAPLTWRGAEGGSGSVSVDPGRFSFVLEALVRRVRGAPDASVTATVEIAEAGAERWLGVTLAGSGADRAAAEAVGAVLEWAIVERVIEAHGGSIETRATGSERNVQLRLPIAP